jgi:hypothetical protein
VSRVRRDQARLRRVTRDAERFFIERREGVRLVASFARDTSRMGTTIDSSDIAMTADARRCDHAWIVHVRLMARNARTLFPVANVDVGMTSDARCCGISGCVRHVAARAYGVGGRRLRAERGLLAVAAHAGGLAPGDELVRLMTADARFVTGWRRSGRLHVARRARRECGDRRLVAAMAIETTRRIRVTGVFRRALAMAARAVCDDDRGRLVDLVALGARERRMPDHGGALTLGLGVTADARGLRKIRREGVARQTGGRRDPEAAAVRDRGLLGVAVAAHVRSGVLEPVALEVVAGAARNIRLSDVNLMSRARPKLGPGGRHGFRRGPPGRARPQDDRHSDGRNDKPQRGCNPGEPSGERLHGATPWHRRHGRSRCSSRELAKPGPCGLPPGPPTRWQPTQSCSPAPP